MPIFARIKTTFTRIIKAVTSVVTSPLSDLVTATMGKTAGLSGFILATNSFLLRIKYPAQIYSAIAGAFSALIIIGTNDFFRNRFFQKQKEKFDRDSQHINNASVQLRNSHQQILQHLEGIVPFAASDELAETLQQYIEDKSHPGLTTLKYTSATIDFVTSATSGAGAMFILFILPMLLLEKMENSTLKDIAIAFALANALYQAVASIARITRDWDKWETCKRDVSHRADGFCEQYSQEAPAQAEALVPNKMAQVMSIWHEKRRHQPPVQEPAAQMAIQMN